MINDDQISFEREHLAKQHFNCENHFLMKRALKVYIGQMPLHSELSEVIAEASKRPD